MGVESSSLQSGNAYTFEERQKINRFISTLDGTIKQLVSLDRNAITTIEENDERLVAATEFFAYTRPPPVPTPGNPIVRPTKQLIGRVILAIGYPGCCIIHYSIEIDTTVVWGRKSAESITGGTTLTDVYTYKRKGDEISITQQMKNWLPDSGAPRYQGLAASRIVGLTNVYRIDDARRLLFPKHDVTPMASNDKYTVIPLLPACPVVTGGSVKITELEPMDYVVYRIM